MRLTDRAAFGGIELEYESRGAGEPVVFVHHGIGLDWFGPLANEPVLARSHRLVTYHRAGYAASSRLREPLAFPQEAANFRSLMNHLGIPRAHVVGHSASACIALQIALDASEVVQSLALLEPALMAVPSPPEVPRAIELYRAGDSVRALETFIRGTCGEGGRAALELVLPGAFDRALTDASTFFLQELPALRKWSFGPEEASRIAQPVLAVVGEHSDARFHRRQELLLAWLPHVEPFVLRGAGHLLHVQHPGAMAEALAGFFARNSMAAAV